jgi:thiopurine S-methyltransferase
LRRKEVIMQREFWLERWQRNEIGFHQQEFNAHLQEYWKHLRVPPEGPVLVPLCGKSRDMLWLRAQGHPVVGVEISALALRDFFTEHRLTPQLTHRPPFDLWQADGIDLLCGDFFELMPSDLAGIVAVYDRASLIALPPPLRERYAARLVELLPSQVEMLLVTMEYPQGQMQGPPFSVAEEEVRALYTRHYRVEPLYTKDILAENPRWRERGLGHLVEKVYRLHPRATA